MDKVIEYLKQKIFIDEYVVVAVSGGPDSMALLDIVNKVTDKIVCAHVNHKVRNESEAEALMVKKYCEQKNIIFEQADIDNYGSDNFHKEARNFRYNFFEQLINKYNASILLTAHHGDDLVETILMRIVRGSTLRGYSGFKKETVKNNYMIIRPLINLSKIDLIDYDEINNVPYAIDKSNYKNVYTRNRFRQIVPFLKAENPNLLSKVNEFSNTLLEYNEFVIKQANIIKKEIFNNNALDLKKFNEQEVIIKKEIIYLILEQFYKDKLDLVGSKHVDMIIHLANSLKANSYIYLPNSLQVVKIYDIISFESLENNLKDYNMELKNTLDLPNGKKISIVDFSDNDSNYTCRLDASQIKLPLYVRNRRNGDKIAIKNLNGHKKIKDILIDNKISLKERNLWPVVVDSNDVIVWLPGLKKSVLDKTQEEKYSIILKYY